jgi:hypothetical protein
MGAKKKTTPQEYAAARALYEEGHKLRVIAERTDVPVWRIFRMAKKDEWKRIREDHLGMGAEPVVAPTIDVISVSEDAGHVATDEKRKLVNAMAGFGLDEEQISVIVGISPDKLRTTYAYELATAPPKMVARVAQSLFQMATDTNKPNVTAAMYLHNKWSGGAEKVEEMGKKEGQRVKAKLVAAGKFAPSAPPKLVASGGKMVDKP